jgi:hypothetical protein
MTTQLLRPLARGLRSKQRSRPQQLGNGRFQVSPNCSEVPGRGLPPEGQFPELPVQGHR